MKKFVTRDGKKVELKFANLGLAIKAVNNTDYTIRGVFSTPDQDRHGEVVNQNGWDLTDFLTNPIVLFQHDPYQPPVGKVIEIGINADGNLEGTIQFAAEQYAFAMTIFNLYRDGFMRAFSVGFMNQEYTVDQESEIVTLEKNILYEVSTVNIPANAMALAKQKGIDVSLIAEMQKTVVPYTDTPTLDEGTEWDGAAAEARVRKWASSDGSGEPDKVDYAKYRKAFAWYDNSSPDVFGSYKLPHHDVVDGELKTVWLGVAAAMAALLGARGGTDIPDDEREGVYNHLAKHYKQYDKEVPEFKSAPAVAKKEAKILTDNERKIAQETIDSLKSLLEIDARSRVDNKEAAAPKVAPRQGAAGHTAKRYALGTINRALRSLSRIKNTI